LNDPEPIEKCSACRGTLAEAEIAWNCIPIPSFGNSMSSRIKVATIGLNPAINEPRLPTLTNYRQKSRDGLTASDIKDAFNRRENYFSDLQSRWHNYFESLDSVIGRVNRFWSFGNCVVHIDLVACATNERFGVINEEPRKTLITNCHQHFLRTLLKLPENTLLLLDGKTVCDEVLKIGQVNFDSKPELIMINPRMSGLRGSITIGEKPFRFRGWNFPVSKLTPLQKTDLANWLHDHCS
jgi:hypothetical protein